MLTQLLKRLWVSNREVSKIKGGSFAVLKLIDIQRLEHESSVNCTYTPSVQTFNITTEFMTDECKPIQLEGGGCIWININGAIGEVEFIYPNTIQKSDSFVVGQSCNGIPLFEVTTSMYDNCYIQILEEGFLIWLKESTKIDLLISHGHQIDYLISNSELCGIFAKNSTIIE